MKDHSELYFTTGEFARILGVKKHTLFHYDKIGLFSPALKKENGYRYYFVWQMDVFAVIRALQKVGMPLEEIKAYMENRSPRRFIDMMEDKEARIDREIERLGNLKRLIRGEKKNIGEALAARLDRPRLVKRSRERLLVSDISIQDERTVAVDIAEHVKMQEEYNGSLGEVGSICLGEDLEQGIYNRYVKIYTKLEKKGALSRAVIRPGGDYVELCYRGYDWSMEKPYRLISRFAGSLGLATGQFWYEDLMLDELTVRSYEDFIVKVMVPVTAMKQAPSDKQRKI